MNNIEFDCVNVLFDLVEHYHCIGVKTSFEDEGATFNEVIRLKEICNQAKTKLMLKIGGPEAIRDIKDSTIIGVKGIVGPMIESDFGLKKFIKSVENHVDKSVLLSLKLAINIETITSINNLDKILALPEINQLYGITIGRVDLVSSMEKDRTFVNSTELYELILPCLIKIKKCGLKVMMGGAISVDSLDFLKKLTYQGLLDSFETRYVIFDSSVSLKNYEQALVKAQEFEYQWLLNKKNQYYFYAMQDIERIEMIKNRININNDKNTILST